MGTEQGNLQTRFQYRKGRKILQLGTWAVSLFQIYREQYRTKCCIWNVWQWDLLVSVPGLRGEIQGGEAMGGGMAVVFIQNPKNIFPKWLQTLGTVKPLGKRIVTSWQLQWGSLKVMTGSYLALHCIGGNQSNANPANSVSIDWSFLSCFIPKCFCSYSEEWENISSQSAFTGETEHPRSFVLSSAALAGKRVMGEMGDFP